MAARARVTVRTRARVPPLLLCPLTRAQRTWGEYGLGACTAGARVCVCEGEGGRGERPRAARCAGVKRRGAGVKALGGGAGGGHGYRRCCWRCSGKCSWRCSCRGDPGRAEVRYVKHWARRHVNRRAALAHVVSILRVGVVLGLDVVDLVPAAQAGGSAGGAVGVRPGLGSVTAG